MNIFDTWIATTPIAHRGLHDDKIPENSLAAFKNAVKNKMPIELDVSVLTDGVPVVFHDERLARMTGKDGFISGCSYADIDNLTLYRTKEHIPTLKEALDVIDGKVPVIVEIKNYGKVGAYEKAIWKVLQNYRGEYAVVSFNPYSLEWFKKNAPKVKRGQSSSFFKDKEIIGVRKFYLKRMLLNKKVSEPNFIVYKSDDMPNKYVKKYYGKLPIIACTVRSAAEETRLKDYCDNYLFDSFVPAAFDSDKKSK